MQGEFATDYSIEQEANKEWLEVIIRLWEAVDKPVDEKRLQNYRRELSSLPIGLLEQSISRCIRENTYTNVPSVGKVWQAVRKELGNPFDIDKAIDTWIEKRFQSAFYRF